MKTKKEITQQLKQCKKDKNKEKKRIVKKLLRCGSLELLTAVKPRQGGQRFISIYGAMALSYIDSESFKCLSSSQKIESLKTITEAERFLNRLRYNIGTINEIKDYKNQCKSM